MAPARVTKPANKTGNAARPRRRWLRMAVIAVAVVLVLLVWFWKPLSGYRIAGTSYGAHVACSCLYIGGRSLGDCRKDFEPGMGLLMLSADRHAQSVTARYPLLPSQTATYRKGEGCVLEKWDD
jgi:hypothetical protein